jgi:phage gpG-like protein
VSGVTGDFAGLERVLATLGTSSQLPRRAVGAVASELSTIVRESFDQQRAPEGGGWRALKDATHRPLVRSGRMRATALRPVLYGLALRIELTTYGGIHLGGAPRAHIPARSFLPAVPLASSIEERLMQAVRRKVNP